MKIKYRSTDFVYRTRSFSIGRVYLKKGEMVEESNEALRKAFRELKKKGYQNLHYLKSEHLLGEDGESTVDGRAFYRFRI